jgi:hypothetical protein
VCSDDSLASIMLAEQGQHMCRKDQTVTHEHTVYMHGRKKGVLDSKEWPVRCRTGKGQCACTHRSCSLHGVPCCVRMVHLQLFTKQLGTAASTHTLRSTVLPGTCTTCYQPRVPPNSRAKLYCVRTDQEGGGMAATATVHTCMHI